MPPSEPCDDLTSSNVAAPRIGGGGGQAADIYERFVLLGEALYCPPALTVMYCLAGYHDMRPRVQGSIDTVGKTSARSGKYRHPAEYQKTEDLRLNKC